MSVMVADPQLVNRIAKFDEAEFRALVDQDLRRNNPDAEVDITPDEVAALRSPALVDRWLMVLSGMAKSVEGQLAARHEDYRAKAARFQSGVEQLETQIGRIADDTPERRVLENKLGAARKEWALAKEKYSRWRAGILRFKSGLEEWMIEARAIQDSVRDKLYGTVVTEERNRLAQRVTDLERAIRDHRDAVDGDDTIDPSDADVHLWAALGDPGSVAAVEAAEHLAGA